MGKETQKIYPCPFDGCGKSYKKPCRLKEHELVHSGERPYICPMPGCDKAYRRSAQLSVHARTHDPETARAYKCSYEGCDKGFLTNQRLRNHEALHAAPRPFGCPHCDECFAKKYQLRAHVSEHTGKKPYPCPECERSFQTRQKLNVHQQTHDPNGHYLCGDCDAGFRTHRLLLAHMAETHPIQCGVCQKTFGKRRHLTLHMRERHLEKPKVTCDRCGAELASTRSLRTHILLIHERDTRYKCALCDKGFPYPSIRDKHLQSHARSPRSNTSSPRKTPTPSAQRTLVNMILGHADDPRRVHACPFENCSHAFIREYDLERHLESKMHADDVALYEKDAFAPQDPRDQQQVVAPSCT